MWIEKDGVLMNLNCIKEIDTTNKKVILATDSLLDIDEEEIQKLVELVNQHYEVVHL